MSSKRAKIDLSSINDLSCLLVSIFCQKYSNILLVETKSRIPDALHNLLQVVPNIRSQLESFVASEPFLKLYNAIYTSLGPQKPFDLLGILTVLYQDILGKPYSIQYIDNCCSYFHLICVNDRIQQHFHVRNMLLNEAAKFKQVFGQYFFVWLQRTGENSRSLILPSLNVSLDGLAQHGNKVELVLSSIICKNDNTRETFSFLRMVNAEGKYNWYRYNNQDSTKIECCPTLENNFMFWANFPDFSVTKIPETLKTIMKDVILCIYIIRLSGEVLQPPDESTVRLATDNTASNQNILPSVSAGALNPQIYSIMNSSAYEASAKHGVCKGVEGNQNSCFIDSLLMSWIYMKPELLIRLLPIPNSYCYNNQIMQQLIEIAKKLANPPYFCDKESVWDLRLTLRQYNKRVVGEMMDVDEFIGCLFKKGLQVPGFIRYETPSGHVTENYIHQIVCPTITRNYSQLYKVSDLLKMSLEYQQLQFHTPPNPILMIKMPRSNGILIGFDSVLPDLTLNIPEFNYGYQSTTSYTLLAVICLHHMHYTTYLRDGDSHEKHWYHFDSMGTTGPQLTPLLDMELHLQMLKEGNYSLKPNSDVSRLLTGIHMCVYIPMPESSVRLLESSIPPPQTIETETLIPATIRTTPREAKACNNSVTTNFEKQEKLNVLMAVFLALDSANKELDSILSELAKHNPSADFNNHLRMILNRPNALMNLSTLNEIARKINYFLLTVPVNLEDDISSISAVLLQLVGEQPYFEANNFENPFVYFLELNTFPFQIVNLNSIFNNGLSKRRTWLNNHRPKIALFSIKRFLTTVYLMPSKVCNFGTFLADPFEVIPIGNLGSIICNRTNDSDYHVYQKTEEASLWRYLRVSENGNVAQIEMVQLPDNLFETQGSYIELERMQLSTNVLLHMQMIVKHSVFLVYTLEEQSKPRYEEQAVNQRDTSRPDRQNLSELQLTALPCLKQKSCLAALLYSIAFIGTRFDEFISSNTENDVVNELLIQDVFLPLRKFTAGSSKRLVNIIRSTQANHFQYDFVQLWNVFCEDVIKIKHMITTNNHLKTHHINIISTSTQRRISSIRDDSGGCCLSIPHIPPMLVFTIVHNPLISNGFFCNPSFRLWTEQYKYLELTLHCVICQRSDEYTVYRRQSTETGVSWVKRCPSSAKITEIKFFEALVIQFENNPKLDNISHPDINFFIRGCVAAFYIPQL